MSLLSNAMDRLTERTEALGLARGEQRTLGAEGDLALLISGIPVPAMELWTAASARTNAAVGSALQGVPLNEVIAGVVVEAVMIGYWVAQEEAGAR